MNRIICLAFLIAFTSCTVKKTETGDAKEKSATNAPDDAAIAAAVRKAYAVISFKPGEKPRYDEVKTAFLPSAHFLNFRTDSLEVFTLDQFEKVFKEFIEGAKISTFYEEELYGKTEQFGRIAHRISTYKTYLNTLDSVAERGVNSFQLVKTNNEWKVTSIIWDVESKDRPIPTWYLGSE